jgi:HD-like signal output (HDOD) protein/ActR/RegA family two-component response regulator
MGTASSAPRILFVDDEPNVLAALRRALRGRTGSWELVFAVGGAEALTLLAAGAVEVIVTDMQMPILDGVAVLEAARTLHPSAGRVVLSGEAARSTIVRSCGLAHAYLAKPCDIDDLVSTIGRLLSVRDLLADPRLRAVLGGAAEIPKPDRICTRLLAVSGNPTSTVGDVVAVVREDIGLCAEIIRIVNSGFFGLGSRIDSVERAATLLGTDMLQALALAGKIAGSGPGRDRLASWADPYPVAIESGRLARLIGTSEGLPAELVSQVALAAMLHDVGLRLLAGSLPAATPRPDSRVIGDVFARRERELDVLGCGVAEATAYLLALWGFHPAIVDALISQPKHDADGTASTAGRILTFARSVAIGTGEPVAPGRWIDPAHAKRWSAVAQPLTSTSTSTSTSRPATIRLTDDRTTV